MLNNVVPRKDIRIKCVQEPVDDLPIKFVMIQKWMNEPERKGQLVNIIEDVNIVTLIVNSVFHTSAC